MIRRESSSKPILVNSASKSKQTTQSKALNLIKLRHSITDGHSDVSQVHYQERSIFLSLRCDTQAIKFKKQKKIKDCESQKCF